jgi:ribosomal protein S16
VTDSRNRRDGRYIERIGFFNPIASGKEQRLKPGSGTRAILVEQRRAALRASGQPDRQGRKQQVQ